MNILLVDDRGSVSKHVKGLLEDREHIVFSAFTIGEAQAYWEDNKIAFDCLIIDLNMDPTVLLNEEIDRTHYGLLTGWIWLKEYVYKKDNSMKQRTIIFSDYLTELKNIVSSKELKKIRCVAKSNSGSSLELLLKHISDIDQISRE